LRALGLEARQVRRDLALKETRQLGIAHTEAGTRRAQSAGHGGRSCGA
jgi:hypothetical protein